MNRNQAPLLALAALFVPCAPALAQTETLLEIERPAGALGGWAALLQPLPDLDGDDVPDLAASRRLFGGGHTRVFSGATGALVVEFLQGPENLFYGRGVAGVSDLSGDGVPDVVHVGAHSVSGSSLGGRLLVQSGADGSVLGNFLPPAGVLFREAAVLALDDVDGDGVEDVLVRTHVPAGVLAPRVQLFSSATGQPLYGGFADPDPFTVLQGPVRLDDRDGDGVADFAITATNSFQGQRVLQLRSGATGDVLQELPLPAELLGVVTGNGEPLVPVADLDGDGLQDLAFGGVLTGYVGVHSSATGAALRTWTCPDFHCLGSILVEVPDRTGDGHPDLMALESSIPAVGLSALLLLDPVTGAFVMDEPIVQTQPGYGMSDSLVPLPGVQGEPSTFVLFDGSADRLEVRALTAPVGDRGCTSSANSTGEASRLVALASATGATDGLRLVATHVPAGQPGLFFFGGSAGLAPLGNGHLCLGTDGELFRLPVAFADDHGLLFSDLLPGQGPAPAGLLLPGTTWHFQGWYRDPAADGATFDLTDAVEHTF